MVVKKDCTKIEVGKLYKKYNWFWNEEEFLLNVENCIEDNYNLLETSSQPETALDNLLHDLLCESINKKIQDTKDKKLIVIYLEQIITLNEKNPLVELKKIGKMLMLLTSVNKTLNLYEYIIKHSEKFKQLVTLFFKDKNIVSEHDILIKVKNDQDLYNILESCAICLGKEIEYIDYSDDDLLSSSKQEDTFSWYLAQCKQFKILTQEEEKELLTLMEQGGEPAKWAKKRLIESNQLLVISFAKRYSRINGDVMELISAGNLGLSTGIDRYDSKRKVKLSTYVSWWIKQQILNSINARGIIKVPATLMTRYLGYKKQLSALEESLGKKASVADIENHLAISEEQQKKYGKVDLADTLSLEEPLDDEQEITFGDALPSELEDVESKVEQRCIAEALKLILKESLKPVEQEIIKCRFGFYGHCMTFKETKDKLKKENLANITGERVRQIQNKILEKLKTIPALQELHSGETTIIMPRPNIPSEPKRIEVPILTQKTEEINTLAEELENLDVTENPFDNIYDYFIEYKEEDVSTALEKLGLAAKSFLNVIYPQGVIIDKPPIFASDKEKEQYLVLVIKPLTDMLIKLNKQKSKKVMVKKGNN